MTDLKTLKDLHKNCCCENNCLPNTCEVISYESLRLEAIKWYKAYMKQAPHEINPNEMKAQADWIGMFFGLCEEDLK